MAAKCRGQLGCRGSFVIPEYGFYYKPRIFLSPNSITKLFSLFLAKFGEKFYKQNDSFFMEIFFYVNFLDKFYNQNDFSLLFGFLTIERTFGLCILYKICDLSTNSITKMIPFSITKMISLFYLDFLQ